MKESILHAMKMVPVAALFWAVGAEAAITVFTDRGTFLEAVGAFGVDDLNDLPSTGRINGPRTRMAGDFGYTATVTTAFFGAGTSGDSWLSTNSQSDVVTLSGFTGGVTAIGGDFFGTNFNGALFLNAVNSFTVVDGGGSLSTSLSSTSTTSFIGFVSDGGIASLTFNRAGTSHFPTLNNLVLAGPAAENIVPEHETWALLVAGFGLVGAVLRRRRMQVPPA